MRDENLIYKEEIYELENLDDARKILSTYAVNNPGQKLILSNVKGSSRYYGVLVIDRMFKILQKEFSEQISEIVVNVYKDPPGRATALELGYKNINYQD